MMGKEGKRLRLSISAHWDNLSSGEILRGLDRYGVDELYVGGFQQFVSYADFPKVRRSTDPNALAEKRAQLRPFIEKGYIIRLGMGREPSVPGDAVEIGRPDGRAPHAVPEQPTPYFFDVYPEARDLRTGLFWKFIEKKTEELLRLVPEAASAMSYVWESPMLNDQNYFRDLYWADISRDLHPVNLGPQQYYSDADYLTELIAALGRGAQAAGRSYQFFAFCHYPWQERLNIAALKQLDPDLPVTLFHFSNAGDWNPYRPASNVLLEITDRETALGFDGGEYWGVSEIPYCYPEEIQQRLCQALERNRHLTAVHMRCGHSRFFTSFNTINLYALSRLAHDPYAPIEGIWRDWAEQRFGQRAAPGVISALKRTDEIGKLVFFFHGAVVTEHSLIGNLDYLEGESLHTARATREWMPWDHEVNFLLKEYLERPSENTIERAVADRMEALRLNQMSLNDIEAVRSALPEADYHRLISQLTLQRHFVEVCLPQIEVLIRFRMQRLQPSAENRRRIEDCCAALEARAVEIEKLYQEQVEILNAKDIRSFVRQVRQSVAELSA